MLLCRRVPQRGPESLFLNLSGFLSRLALGAEACAGLAETFVRRLLRRTFGSWYQHLHSPSMEGEIMQLEKHSDTAAFDPYRVAMSSATGSKKNPGGPTLEP